MPLQAFDQICPEELTIEIRVMEASQKFGVPEGDYFLREFYCNESGCDCRRVSVQFVPKEARHKIAATISYGWERAKYYRKWSRDPELWREMAGATLEMFAVQGPRAHGFLALFKDLVQDPQLVAAFRRRYAMVKEQIKQGHFS